MALLMFFFREQCLSQQCRNILGFSVSSGSSDQRLREMARSVRFYEFFKVFQPRYASNELNIC